MSVHCARRANDFLGDVSMLAPICLFILHVSAVWSHEYLQWKLLLRTFSCNCKSLDSLEQSHHETFGLIYMTRFLRFVFSVYIRKVINKFPD